MSLLCNSARRLCFFTVRLAERNARTLTSIERSGQYSCLRYLMQRNALRCHNEKSSRAAGLGGNFQFASAFRTCTSSANQDDDQEDNMEWLQDTAFQDAFEEHYLLPQGGHSVFILQPDFKMPQSSKKMTTTEHQLQEACALVHTLPGWGITDKAIYSVKHRDKSHIWGKGNFAEITERIRKNKRVTAVFVVINMLTGLQLAELQQAWGVPVYDRYTVVLQIFQKNARSKEAKLQVALAEIPYLRSRLRGVHMGTLGRQQGALFTSSQTSLDKKREILQDREVHLKKALQKVRSHRALLKKERQKRHLPTVAVVGYTNAGKTSLIRALTGDASMQPRDQLFATLDVTVHSGVLPNRLAVLFVDTVGFISDIPTDLIASFSATLGDMLDADAIIIVNDISHPDVTWQRKTVQETLESLQLPEKLAKNIIEVNNKIDLLDGPPMETNTTVLSVSAETGEGLTELRTQVQGVILQSTGRLKKRIRVPLNGPHLSWLHKEATVEKTRVMEGDSESLLLEAVFTEAAFARFQKQFGPRRPTKTRHRKPSEE